jgi:hypothetical protein
MSDSGVARGAKWWSCSHPGWLGDLLARQSGDRAHVWVDRREEQSGGDQGVSVAEIRGVEAGGGGGSNCIGKP